MGQICGPWPLLHLETATAEHIRAARDALASPMERIVHEFLWFWPLEAPGASDAACALLARGDIRGAEAIWRGEQAKGSPVRAAVALHNLAVLAHALALESVLSTLSAGATGWDYERDVNWAAITALWDEVFASDEAWGYVERRVSALADPAVTTEDVEALRQGALPTLVGISVGLALRSAARGLVDEALHHAQVGRDWAARLPRHQEAQPFDLATGPLRRSVEGRCSAAKQGGLADPAGAARRAHSLVEEVRLDLNTLDLVLGHHRALLDPCLDTFAGTILTLVGASTEATAGVGNALSLVTIAAWWAASPSVAQEAAEMRDYLASVGARPAGDRGSAGAEISAVISADMYTQNPFRMAALRVDCGATQIAERQEEVEAAARQVGKVAAGPWPWETMAGSGDPAAVAEALGTLSSPAERKVWEAFWFWPQHRDPSLWDAALARGQDSADVALDLCQRQTELFVDPCVPLHNIAVCLHLEALERERQGEQPERWTTVDGPTCEDAWLDAYTAWEIPRG